MDILILALATWRISNLLAAEDGPFEIFERLRNFIGVRNDERSQHYGTNELARWMLCVWCNSVAVGALWTVAYWINSPVTIWVALPLALSAATVLVDSLIP